MQISSLLCRPGNRARSRPGRPSHLGASVSAITRLNANLYFAPTAAVRSTRLSELEVVHAVAVVSDSSGNKNGTDLHYLQGSAKRLFSDCVNL